MALKNILVTVAVIAAVVCDYHEFQTENKTEKALEAEKGQKPRSANPERGSMHQLTALMNNSTDYRRPKTRDRGKINKIRKQNAQQKHQHDDNNMMNDNGRSDFAINQKTRPDNTTDPLNEKINYIWTQREGPNYYAVEKSLHIPKVTGVFCNFENSTTDLGIDICMWSWNVTTSHHGLGFQVLTPSDVALLNTTVKGFRFTGPATDADNNINGHFLYLAVDPTSQSMVIKSPAFQGLWEFCKFEVRLHQSRMQNASIRLVSESFPPPGVQLILQEVAGNNLEVWSSLRFTIGRVQQEVRIMIEITPPAPSWIDITKPLPHIAIDNIRMLDCLPEPPVFKGQCQHGQLKCNIMGQESCIKLQQVCDLVRDCDDGSDETQHCDKMPEGSYCNFEQDACGFENVPQPILRWSRHSGPTPTDKTGPDYDHTCGPPDLYPTKIPPPPLAPTHLSHINAACVGYYFYVNMNVTGPNQEKADFASTAVMKTKIFNPPPKVHGNNTSKYYNCCMIRFYYQQNGRNYGSLSVELIELTSRGNISIPLWFSTKDKGKNWYRAAIFLPNVTTKYYLQFKTRMGMRIYSDSAIDDFSMAPECFGLNIDPAELGDYNYYNPIYTKKTTTHDAFADKIYYRFTTCGATGRKGPSQAMCDMAYENTTVKVSVQNRSKIEGVQMWEVPAEGLYTIIATGASGGLGSSWAGISHGAQVRALFELHKGEKIYMLIGQQGLNACKKTLSAREGQICGQRNSTALSFKSKTHEVRNTQVVDGGGGGGGATYVFLIGKDGKPFPLLVAGGGGGISVGIFKDDGSQHGKPLTNDTAESGFMYGGPGVTSGAGGGWRSRPGPITPGFEIVIGQALLDGGQGGKACVHEADGGFGGGGGGCSKGGGGGGWHGGNTNDAGNHGSGGWSYIDTSRAIRDYSEVNIAQKTGPGEVLIVPAIHDCGCDYRCVALNEYRSEYRCYCPASWITDINDANKCILTEKSWIRLPWVVVGAFIGLFLLCIVFVTSVCLFLYSKYQRHKEAEVRQKHLLEQEMQLHRLRNAPGTSENPLSMAFNPHYGSESMLPQGIDVRGLPQVSRESLKLVKALGQGAFGEVYQGLYRHRTGDSVEMPVAVKTLPELSTGQAESDFLMEAAIMAKFNHPNIVHLIGVCFDRHPRFIVLELLAGGDLKNFLRESRPKPERASALTMKDLLLCSLDVCKGCRYLEAQRFIHRDIAARNCLLTSRGPGRVVKIADFGMARDIYRADYYKKGGKAMLPIKWMPPEAYIDGVFTIKTDVWSFGVLLWEVFSLGVMPYTGCANREVMELVSGGGRLEKPYGCPNEIYRLMCECWNPTPLERPAFSHMFDRLQRFLQDPEIVSAPLPVVRSLLPPSAEVQVNANGPQRPAACDYLVPMSPQENLPSTSSSTDPLVPHSKSPTAGLGLPDGEGLPFPPLLKASQDYGNIPMGSRGAGVGKAADGSPVSTQEMKHTKFPPSNSTDRLLDGASMNEDIEESDKPVIWETSFTEPPRPKELKQNSLDHSQHDSGPAVDKLISITPTSPKPPENALTKAIEANVIDKTIHLIPERKPAPIASPDPPRINAWVKDPPMLLPKPKPLCLDAAQLEQNLNALKKNSGSVNLNTMNINVLPPYINVVTPNKLSEAKTIQIDPKKAVIHDLQSPEEPKEEKSKLKQSNSAGSLLNGPMTDVPYADSDNASSSSGSNAQNLLNNQKNKNNYTEIVVGNDRSKIIKQGSNGKDSEISC